jgi:ABC-type dipeptide/oligopeptide/nickel transport system ATPase component
VFTAPRHDHTRRLLAAVPPDDAAQPWQPFPDEVEIAAEEDRLHPTVIARSEATKQSP